MAVVVEEMRFPVSVPGAKKAEEEIKGVGDAAGRTRREFGEAENGVKKLGGGAKAAGAGVKNLGERFDDLNDRMAKVGGRFGDVRSRFGEVEDAVKVLSGVALFELGEALYDIGKAFYDWTDAGQAANRMQEAQAEAVTKTVEKLVAMEAMISSVSSKDIVAYTRATREQARIQKELNAAMDEQLEAEDEVNAARGRGKTRMKAAAIELGEATKKVNDLREAYARVNTVVRDFDDRRVFEAASDARKRVADTQKEQAAKDKEQASKWKEMQDSRLAYRQSLAEREIALIFDANERELAALREKHRQQLVEFDKAVKAGAVDPTDRGRLTALQQEAEAQLIVKQGVDSGVKSLDEMAKADQEATKAAEARASILQSLAAREIALISDRDERALASMEDRFRRERELLEDQIADGIAKEEDRVTLTKVQDGERAAAAEDASKRRQEASKKEAMAYAQSADAALGAAASLAEAMGASAAVIAGINIAKEVAAAATETALAASSAAIYDIPGAIAHGAAAASHIAAAIKWGSDALGSGQKPSAGGGGGGAASPSPDRGPPPRELSEAPESAAPVYNINFAQPPFSTKADVEDGVLRLLDSAVPRRGRVRIRNLNRLGR